MNPLVSIIVPVYNAEKYLKRCLDSLIAIDYDNKEIILVDDKGQDNSGEICDIFERQYSQVHVVHHNINKGVTEARISGLDCSHGDYIMFVDADDAVIQESLNILVESALKQNADVVSCGAFFFDGIKRYSEQRTIIGVFDKNDIQQLLTRNILYDVTIRRSGIPLYLCAKLYKRELLHESLQKASAFRYGEDIVANLDILMNKTNKLVCLDDCIYDYYHHSGQVTSAGLIRLWSDYEKLWLYIDGLSEGLFASQLQQRIWSYIKPNLYEPKSVWGGLSQYIRLFKKVRNSSIVKKYIFSGKPLPIGASKHPHYYLLKYRLYLLDYWFYCILWARNK